MKRQRPENDNAFRRDAGRACFYVELVLPDCTYGVFGTYTGHCYATYLTRESADEHALRLVNRALERKAG
jgi:hypothetical protein